MNRGEANDRGPAAVLELVQHEVILRLDRRLLAIHLRSEARSLLVAARLRPGARRTAPEGFPHGGAVHVLGPLDLGEPGPPDQFPGGGRPRAIQIELDPVKQAARPSATPQAFTGPSYRSPVPGAWA